MFARLVAIVVLTLGPAFMQVEAQQIDKTARVGFVAPQGRSLPLFDAFRQGLADLGYVEGRDITIESRFADGQYDRFPRNLCRSGPSQG